MVGIGNDSGLHVRDYNYDILKVGDCICEITRPGTIYTIVGNNDSLVFCNYSYETHDNKTKHQVTRIHFYDISKRYVKVNNNKPLILWPFKS